MKVTLTATLKPVQHIHTKKSLQRTDRFISKFNHYVDIFFISDSFCKNQVSELCVAS